MIISCKLIKIPKYEKIQKKVIIKDRYWCPTKKDVYNFEKLMRKRKQRISKMEGYINCEVNKFKSFDEYECTQIWDSMTSYNNWLNSESYNKSLDYYEYDF